MESVAYEILNGEYTQRINELKTHVASPEFRERFSDVLERFIAVASANFTPRPPTETITREGSVGILPSPAKRIVTQEVLQGNAPSPLRVIEETIPTGVPERPVELVSIHVINEIEPLTAGSMREQDNLAAVLLYLGSIRRKNVYLDPHQPNEHPVRVDQIRAVYHLIKRGAFGQYSLERHLLTNPSDVTQALGAYQRGLDFILPFQQDVPTSEDMVAHEIIDPRILSEIRADSGGLKISIPVIVSPKEYEFRSGWRYESITILRNFYNGDPFILAQTYEYPRLVRYNGRNFIDIK
ncbi:hypothetical protein HYS96_03075 [Candidatus Daviesbacteria bacterium]|nr:hypothetical protein [Candidatus Daviesbacteria bacterium]